MVCLPPEEYKSSAVQLLIETNFYNFENDYNNCQPILESPDASDIKSKYMAISNKMH